MPDWRTSRVLVPERGWPPKRQMRMRLWWLQLSPRRGYAFGLIAGVPVVSCEVGRWQPLSTVLMCCNSSQHGAAHLHIHTPPKQTPTPKTKTEKTRAGPVPCSSPARPSAYLPTNPAPRSVSPLHLRFNELRTFTDAMKDTNPCGAWVTCLPSLHSSVNPCALFSAFIPELRGALFLVIGTSLV